MAGVFREFRSTRPTMASRARQSPPSRSCRPSIMFRKATLSRACFSICHLSCHQPQRTFVANIILTRPVRPLAGLQPSCPGGIHRVTLTIRHPRRSKHRAHRAPFSCQEPPRCGCKVRRCARSGAGGRIREEARHSKGSPNEELLDDPEIDVVYNPVRLRIFPS
jgi:hypothetical protein